MELINNLDYLIGKELTQELEDKLRMTRPSFRIKKPGYMYTQEIRPYRCNIVVNELNIITAVQQG